MRVVIAFVVGVLATRCFVLGSQDLLRAPALQRTNYRGRVLPTAGGMLAVMAVLVVEAGRSTLGAFDVGDASSATTARLLILLAVLGFALLGLVDDLAGTSDDQGFRGHLRAMAQGRMTTGVVKIIGGIALALVLVGAGSDSTSGGRVVADAALVALAANLANLFDRAPGRAIKVGAVAWIPIAIMAGSNELGVALAPVVGAFVGLLGDDLRERLMLGDAGAYALGAALGVAVVLECDQTTRSVVLVVLACLTVAAELVSFSRVINRVPPLRALDMLGRRADE